MKTVEIGECAFAADLIIYAKNRNDLQGNLINGKILKSTKYENKH